MAKAPVVAQTDKVEEQRTAEYVPVRVCNRQKAAKAPSRTPPFLLTAYCSLPNPPQAPGLAVLERLDDLLAG